MAVIPSLPIKTQNLDPLPGVPSASFAVGLEAPAGTSESSIVSAGSAAPDRSFGNFLDSVALEPDISKNSVGHGSASVDSALSQSDFATTATSAGTIALGQSSTSTNSAFSAEAIDVNAAAAGTPPLEPVATDLTASHQVRDNQAITLAGTLLAPSERSSTDSSIAVGSSETQTGVTAAPMSKSRVRESGSSRHAAAEGAKTVTALSEGTAPETLQGLTDTSVIRRQESGKNHAKKKTTPPEANEEIPVQPSKQAGNTERSTDVSIDLQVAQALDAGLPAEVISAALAAPMISGTSFEASLEKPLSSAGVSCEDHKNPSTSDSLDSNRSDQRLGSLTPETEDSHRRVERSGIFAGRKSQFAIGSFSTNSTLVADDASVQSRLDANEGGAAKSHESKGAQSEPVQHKPGVSSPESEDTNAVLGNSVSGGTRVESQKAGQTKSIAGRYAAEIGGNTHSRAGMAQGTTLPSVQPPSTLSAAHTNVALPGAVPSKPRAESLVESLRAMSGEGAAVGQADTQQTTVAFAQQDKVSVRDVVLMARGLPNGVLKPILEKAGISLAGEIGPLNTARQTTDSESSPVVSESGFGPLKVPPVSIERSVPGVEQPAVKSGDSARHSEGASLPSATAMQTVAMGVPMTDGITVKPAALPSSSAIGLPGELQPASVLNQSLRSDTAPTDVTNNHPPLPVAADWLSTTYSTLGNSMVQAESLQLPRDKGEVSLSTDEQANIASAQASNLKDPNVTELGGNQKKLKTIENKELRKDTRTLGTSVARFAANMQRDSHATAVSTPWTEESSRVALLGAENRVHARALEESGPERTTTLRTLSVVRDVIEHVQGTGRRTVEISLQLAEGDTLAIQIQLRGGVAHTTFRTDSQELREALAESWQKSMPAVMGGEAPLRLAEPSFVLGSPAAKQEQMDLGGQMDRQQQGNAEAEARSARDAMSHAFASRSRQPASVTSGGETSPEATARPMRPENSRLLHTFA